MDKRLIDFNELALKTAQKSPCQKRKVGAVVISEHGDYEVGFNYAKDGLPCENKGATREEVQHAEITAINRFYDTYSLIESEIVPYAIYITQPPCENCKKAILNAGIKEENIFIVNDFMKFDSGKLRYELIPTSTTKALAEVLTYGAKKYKANNWRNGEIDRYIGAALRHFEAYRSGEVLDKESGLPHLYHLITNIAFLIELDNHLD